MPGENQRLSLPVYAGSSMRLVLVDGFEYYAVFMKAREGMFVVI